jgi:cytochrome b subunit of formate dehydrogenase
MIYILIVIIRSICDSYIITSNNALAGKYAEGYRMVFFNNNSIIILIIVIGLLIYRILMMIGEGKNDRHKHIKK